MSLLKFEFRSVNSPAMRKPTENSLKRSESCQEPCKLTRKLHESAFSLLRQDPSHRQFKAETVYFHSWFQRVQSKGEMLWRKGIVEENCSAPGIQEAENHEKDIEGGARDHIQPTGDLWPTLTHLEMHFTNILGISQTNQVDNHDEHPRSRFPALFHSLTTSHSHPATVI